MSHFSYHNDIESISNTTFGFGPQVATAHYRRGNIETLKIRLD